MTSNEEMMLDELWEEYDDGCIDLDEWEARFVTDLHDRFEENEEYQLTDKQSDKLKEIWERYCDD